MLQKERVTHQIILWQILHEKEWKYSLPSHPDLKKSHWIVQILLSFSPKSLPNYGNWWLSSAINLEKTISGLDHFDTLSEGLSIETTSYPDHLVLLWSRDKSPGLAEMKYLCLTLLELTVGKMAPALVLNFRGSSIRAHGLRSGVQLAF